MPSPQLQIRCRQITAADLDRTVDLLVRGLFRTRDFWMRGLNRLSEHATPAGFPKYGYLLECNGAPVGVLLLIYSAVDVNGASKIRCNVSSWYVEPEYRNYAPLLVTRALSQKHVTYFNITPVQHTWPILEAQGFTPYCSGWVVAASALSVGAGSRRARVEIAGADICAAADLPQFEIELLTTHAKYGCFSLICSSANRRHPFVFLPIREPRRIPKAYLAYCRDPREFIQFAGPLGRFLARHGLPMVIIDSNGPIKGLVGRYHEHRKYCKGPDMPRLGDLAYSERVMFGF